MFLEKYIKVTSIFNKLKKAEEENAVLYIHALGGFGKTAAAFAFAQFILDYGAFIEADQSHYMITE